MDQVRHGARRLLRAAGRRSTSAIAAAVLCASAAVPGVSQHEAPRRDTSDRQARGPLAPDDALAAFALEPGYRIELAAAEPLVKDPVAIAFDERGRMYVVENRGYPGPLEGSGVEPPPQGVVAILEDTDRDGRYDSRVDFARNLTYPNGIMPWKGGVFVTCAPDLLYLKDLDGDGIADERRVALTGFDNRRTPQLRFSHPTLGIDNWVYLTSGLTGARVTVPDRPDRPAVVLEMSDSRFNPSTLAFEAAGGQAQYGLTFDDYGRRFICSNRRPVMHVVLEPQYLKRNPHLPFSETAEDVSPAGAQAAVWPISGDTTTASFMPGLMGTPHAGTFTAASGVHIHRGDALPPGGRDSIFICESAQNLVQRQIRSPAGVTFSSHPATPGRDFLASRDTWFRPVFAANGPDGALYIVDMYRRIIDHPQYVPEQSRALLDFEAGRERGRIYRVSARDRLPDRTPIDLGRMSARQLARTLEHPNAWWRETAQRLIVERREQRAAPFLRRIAREGRTEAARLHALWTLDDLGRLDPGEVAAALRDRGAAVRENAVRLAEPLIERDRRLRSGVLRLAHDAEERVRFRVALALGATEDRDATGALASIARRDGADRWIRAAVLASVGERSGDFLRAFAASASSPVAARAAVMQDLGQVFGASETAERCLDFILRVTGPESSVEWQPAALSGLAAGLRSRRRANDGSSALMALLSSGSDSAKLATRRVEEAISRSAAVALDANAASEQRLAAVRLLGETDYALAGNVLQTLLGPQQAPDIQAAAVRALSQLPQRAAAASLVDAARWRAFTPRLREAVLGALLTDERDTLVLLDAIDEGVVPAAALGPARRGRLTGHRNADIQKRARALFADLESGDRMHVYERLRATVLARTADAANGKRVFAGQCAACHTVEGTGGQVGPDLTGIRNQPADAILLHVVVPEYEIAAGYQSYIIETRDGRTLVGRVESEAPNSVTLRDAAAQQHVVLRADVASMSASMRSLMPGELERALSEQDLADVIAYLKADPRPE